MKQINAAGDAKVHNATIQTEIVSAENKFIRELSSVNNDKTENILRAENIKEKTGGRQPWDITVELLRGFVVFDSADSSHAAGLTKVRVKHLQRDTIWNTETTLWDKGMTEQDWKAASVCV